MKKLRPAKAKAIRPPAGKKRHEPASLAAPVPAAAAASPRTTAKHAAKAGANATSKVEAKSRAKPARDSVDLPPSEPVAAKPHRVKEKLVRDSFTMSNADFALIQQLKERAQGFKRATKKSDLLRAGLQALAGLSDSQLQAQLGKLTMTKAGRPEKAD